MCLRYRLWHTDTHTQTNVLTFACVKKHCLSAANTAATRLAMSGSRAFVNDCNFQKSSCADWTRSALSPSEFHRNGHHTWAMSKMLNTSNKREAILHVHTVHEGTGLDQGLWGKNIHSSSLLWGCAWTGNMTICTCLVIKVQVPFVSQAHSGPPKCSCSSWCPPPPMKFIYANLIVIYSIRLSQQMRIWCGEMLDIFWSGKRHFSDTITSLKILQPVSQDWQNLNKDAGRVAVLAV